jgi:hypothetical protein
MVMTARPSPAEETVPVVPVDQEVTLVSSVLWLAEAEICQVDPETAESSNSPYQATFPVAAELAQLGEIEVSVPFETLYQKYRETEVEFRVKSCVKPLRVRAPVFLSPAMAKTSMLPEVGADASVSVIVVDAAPD